MKISLSIAGILFRLSQGEILPAGSAKHALIEDLAKEGIIERKGRIKKTLQVPDTAALHTYLQNRCSIPDLALYIETLSKETVTKSELVAVSSDSKLVVVRSFTGFLVNCYEPVEASFHGANIILQPPDGMFHFVYDAEHFIPAANITIVGVENPANFRFIRRQAHLFAGINPLFISRYPQSQHKDVITWLQRIPNAYLHFGDFDVAGLNIYINEYAKHLPGKTSFFLPDNIETLIKEYGNKARYDNQRLLFDVASVADTIVLTLIRILHRYRKGLDQELLIG